MRKEGVTSVKFDDLMKSIHTEGIVGTGLIVALFLTVWHDALIYQISF